MGEQFAFVTEEEINLLPVVNKAVLENTKIQCFNAVNVFDGKLFAKVSSNLLLDTKLNALKCCEKYLKDNNFTNILGCHSLDISSSN